MKNSGTLQRPLLHTIIFAMLIFISSSHAEEVGKFAWKGSLKGIDNTLIVPPVGTVAMSEFIYTSTISDKLTEKDPCSIMFIIDNSASNTTDKTDYYGERFQATIELIEDIYEKAPETKVGLVLFGSRLWFYQPDNPDLFQSIPEDQFHQGNGACIPPLELDKIYEGNAKGFRTGGGEYKKKGVELLKMYLETYMETGMNGGTQTNYTPTHRANYPFVSHNSQLTNITIAFDAARHAHQNQNPTLNNNRHFNIFFSDGLAALGTVNPDYARMRDYIKGTDAAPTFTVFYKSKSDDLAALQEMTTNIQNNGYSPLNSKKITTILNLNNWADIKGKTKDLFNKILTSTSGTPTKVTINTSKISTTTNDSGFIYQEMFPLQKGKTPFTMDMMVHLKKDSLDEYGNIIKTTEKDSLFELAFDVEPGPAGAASDSMYLQWWGRTLSFGKKGAPVTGLSSEDAQIDLLFETFRVDTFYTYKDVQVELRTADKSDVETVSLSKNGDDWTVSVDRAIGTASKEDGVLQHRESDTIYAVFRNPALPLDTMEIKIFYSDKQEWKLGESAYFDNSGDGKIDSLFVMIDGIRWESHSDSIAKVILLPAGRDFEKVSWNQTGGGIGFTLKQKSETINTAVTDSDAISVSEDTPFPNSSTLLKSSVIPDDRVAPVLLTAHFEDSVREESIDRMSFTFSEEIKPLSEGVSFRYFDAPDFGGYDVTLISLENSGSSITAVIEKSGEYRRVSEKDSVNIKVDGTPQVEDLPGNVQNRENIRREITTEKIADYFVYEPTAVIYFDRSGDGLIDAVHLTVKGRELEDKAADIIDHIALPAWRNISRESYSVSGNVIEMSVTVGSTFTGTDLGDEDRGSAGDTIRVAEKIVIAPYELTFVDSMAPVIMSAHLEDSVKIGSLDRLHLELSEPVNSASAGRPFQFYSTGKGELYEVSFSLIQASGKSVTAEMAGTADISIAEGDSVRILVGSGDDVTDMNSLLQRNKNNILRPITVDSLFEGVRLEEAAFFDRDSDGKIDEVSLLFKGNEKGLQSNEAAIIDRIQLPKQRDLTMNSYTRRNGVYHLSVTQNSGDISTAISADDSVALAGDQFSDGTLLFASSVLPEDRMAPVLTEAFFHDSVITLVKAGKSKVSELGGDSLELRYSESIEFDRSDEVSLFVSGDESFRMSTGEAKTVLNDALEWSFLWQNRVPQQGDSVRIDVAKSGAVRDLFGNVQELDRNRLVEVRVERTEIDSTVPSDFSYTIHATVLGKDEVTVPAHLANSGAVLEMDVPTGDKTNEIMAIAVVPTSMDSVTALDSCWADNLTIIDPLGNIINSGMKMIYDRETSSLLYFWNGKNKNGRRVGSGSYVAYVEIHPTFKERPKEPEVLQKVVGVQR